MWIGAKCFQSVGSREEGVLLIVSRQAVMCGTSLLWVAGEMWVTQVCWAQTVHLPLWSAVPGTVLRGSYAGSELLGDSLLLVLSHTVLVAAGLCFLPHSTTVPHGASPLLYHAETSTLP